MFFKKSNEINENESENCVDNTQILTENLENKESSGKIIISWIIPIAVAAAIALLVRIFIGGATTVQGESMFPTLNNGDIVIVNKMPSYSSSFNRTDIVILDAPEEKDRLYIKRIIGMPGETIEISDGKILVDGKWLREYYLNEPKTGIYVYSKWILKDDEYFVLGDNRIPGKSNDSRIFGPIKANSIHGVAVFRIWPFTNAGVL